MMFKSLLFFILLFVFVGCGSQTESISPPKTHVTDKISVYFSKISGSYDGGIDEMIVRDIDEAKESVYLAIYELTNNKIKDALIRAKNSGLDVVVMTDDDMINSDIEELKKADILVYDDGKSALMHDKFMILDKHLVWSGSTNYTYYAFYRNNENAVRIDDSYVADAYLKEFDELVKGSKESIIYKSSKIDIYFSPDDDFKQKLISLIDSANDKVYFMIYAFTDKDVADALIRAKDRGVEVRGVFDESFSSNQYSKDEYLKNAGVDIKYDGNSFSLHDKIMMFDEEIVVTGSYNFTLSANNYNSENSLIIKDKNIYKKYEEEFEKIYTNGKD